MRYRDEQFQGVPGFQVFDELEGREELDRRAGLLVRFRNGRFELNRPALGFLVEVGGLRAASSLKHRGVMLLFDAERRRAGIALAPVECPSSKRLPVALHADLTVRSGLSAEWPMAVAGRNFLGFFGLAMPSEDLKVEPVGGVLTFRAFVESEAFMARVRAQV